MLNKSFVLSGGGVRAFAHLGAVKALQEQGIHPSGIAGTSAGAIAGAFLADGFTPDEIKEMFNGKSRSQILAWNSLRTGFISNRKLRSFLQKNLRHSKFEDLQIPFYATATNFVDGRQTIFSEGILIDAILAACSIPVLFPPVFIGGIPYVDGGLSNNLPVEPFINKKNETVCIYVNPVKLFKQKESITEIMDRALHLSFREMVGRSSAGCFLYIEPEPLKQFNLFDFHKSPEIFDIGYNYTKEILKQRQYTAPGFATAPITHSGEAVPAATTVVL